MPLLFLRARFRDREPLALQFRAIRDDAQMSLTDSGDLGLFGYVLSGLGRVAFDVDWPEVTLAVFPAIDQRFDMIQRPFLANDDDAADVAFAATVIEYALADARRCALIVGISNPFLAGARHPTPPFCSGRRSAGEVDCAWPGPLDGVVQSSSPARSGARA